MKNLFRSVWSSTVILLLTLSGPVGTALYSHQAIGLDIELFGPAVHAQEESEDLIDLNVDVTGTVNRLPSVGARNIRLVPNESDGSYDIGFDVVNYEKQAIDDLYYKVMLIDPKTEGALNQLIAEDYLTYDLALSSEPIAIGPDSSERIHFTYTPPQIAAGEYRVRVRMLTSRDEELGWADATLEITDTADTFVALTPVSVTLDRDPVGLDRPEPNGFGPLHGVTVDPQTQATLNYEVQNAGTAAATFSPELLVKDWGLFGETVATHSGESTTLSPGASETGSLTFEVPQDPGAYRLELTMQDGDTQVSSLGEYRIVVAGATGRILSGQVNEVVDGSLLLTTRVVGPADRVSSIEAAVTGAVLDGGKTVSEVTTDPITLDDLGSRQITFRLPLEGTLSDPRVRLVLTSSQGEVLDTYEFNIDAIADESGALEAPAASATSGSSSIATLTIIIIVVIVVALIVIFMRNRGGNKAPPTSGTIATLLGLAIVGTFLVSSQFTAKAQGPGGEYYQAALISTTTVFINSPIHENDPGEPGEEYDQGSIPFEIDMTWNHCRNRVSYGGLAVDVSNTPGHVYPSTSDWVPAHDLIRFAQNLNNNIYISNYAGTEEGAADWNVLVDQELTAGRFVHSGLKHNTFVGNLAVPEDLDKATIRVSGYGRQRIGVSAGNPEPVHSWFGTYTHLTFEVPPPPLPPIQKPSAGISAPDNVYLGTSVSALSTSHAYVTAPWQNQDNPLDVNNDGTIAPQDFLAIANLLNDVGSVSLPYQAAPPFIDVDGDGSLTESDADAVRAVLNGGDSRPATGSEWQNQGDTSDVNNDGQVSPSDNLAVINAINNWREGSLPELPAPYYDVNGDRQITPEDPLVIQAALNAATGGTPPDGSDLACCNNLEHEWEITYLDSETPTDVTPANNTNKTVSFSPDAVGQYLIRLVVSIPGPGGTEGSDGVSQITLDPNNGQTFNIASAASGDTEAVRTAVVDAIRDKQLTTSGGTLMGTPTHPLLAETGGTGRPFTWDDNGSEHTATLTETCRVLGYRDVASYSTADGERSRRYQNGKHNFHSPNQGGDRLWLFDGSDFVEGPAVPKYGNRWIASIACTNLIPECSDGWDNDGDGTSDAADPSCHTDFDASNAASYDPNIHNENAAPSVQAEDGSTLSDFAEHIVTVLEPAALPVCPAPYLDTNGDGNITDDDARAVQDYLNRVSSGTATTPPQTGAVYQNQNNTLDVDDNGAISPIDGLLIINYRNANGPATAPTTLDPVCTVAPPNNPPSCPAPYLDVNGDGYVTAIDQLLLINRINGVTTEPVPTTGAPWQNQDNPLDVNADGTPTTPIDLLNIINYMNEGHSADIGVHSCTTSTPPAAPQCPPPFLDVDGDSILAPIDMLIMFNHINGLPSDIATTGAPWQNQDNPLDVNNDGIPATPIDALQLINHFNAGHDGQLGTPSCATPPPPPTDQPPATFDPGIFREIE